MAKKARKGKKSPITLKAALEAAVTTIGIASTVYGALQQHRQSRSHPADDVPDGHADGSDGAHGQADRIGFHRDDQQGTHVHRGDCPEHRNGEGHGQPGTGPAGPATAMGDAGESGIGRAIGTAGAVIAAVKTLEDLNTAPPDALMTLRKIGKKRARKIIAKRPFKRIKDLKRILPKRVYKVVKHQLAA